VIFSGTGPTRTIDYIIRQSPLIDLYRGCHEVIKNNYFILARTRKHSLANYRRTFHRLLDHVEHHDPHTFHAGREAEYSFPDQLIRGAELLQAQSSLAVDAIAGEAEGVDDGDTEPRELRTEDFEM